jgi:hypothetical protein
LPAKEKEFTLQRDGKVSLSGVNAVGAQLRVIIFTGLPGTGKSTLAEQVARTAGAPAFAGDWLMGALSPRTPRWPSLTASNCICSDEAIHRARIEGRIRGIPGWHEVGWDHVERMRAEVPH